MAFLSKLNRRSCGFKIPPGSFMMGCSPGDNECKNDEKPARHIEITNSFEMGKFEVTQTQWQTLMSGNPSTFKGASLPVETVSWEQVQTFLARLNDRNDGFRYRLPTEEEWEYAARAGSPRATFGPLDQIAWYGNNSGRAELDTRQIWTSDRATYERRMEDNGNQTHPVGQRFESSLAQNTNRASEAEPVSLGLLIDVSGSTKQILRAARDAAVALLRAGNTADEYFVESFSDRPTLEQDFTSDSGRLQTALTSLSAGGKTAMRDAVYLGLEKVQLGANARKGLPLIVGDDDNQSRYTFENLRDFARRQNVRLFAIALGMSTQGRSELEELTGMHGGNAIRDLLQ
jgi:Sulfatase-modifying factor enzyme 1/von Willebrand factor type A domain